MDQSLFQACLRSEKIRRSFILTVKHHRRLKASTNRQEVEPIPKVNEEPDANTQRTKLIPKSANLFQLYDFSNTKNQLALIFCCLSAAKRPKQFDLPL